MSLSIDDTIAELGVPSLKSGLSASDIEQRRDRWGINELEQKEKEQPWQKWLEQFQEPLNVLLLGSAAVSVMVGQIDDAICITLALLIVITVGIVQEYRSEKSLEALSNLVPPSCHLVRDNHVSTVYARELVPGDVVKFGTGDRIPADVRIATAYSLSVDESTLTGEALPRRKVTGAIEGDGSDASINERENIAFMGTLVSSGEGTGIVVATGTNTEFGSIFDMVDQVSERRTPLQSSMDELAQRLSIISLTLIGCILLIGIFQNRPWLEMFTIGVSLAVAAIPEGLPIVVTVTLALGAIRMSHLRAIMKHLPSIETLGSMSVVCTDKTGTLTTGEMRVIECYTVPDGQVSPECGKASLALRRCLIAGSLCNDAQIEDDKAVGSPTEAAMVRVLHSFNLPDQRNSWVRTNTVPFSSESKMMSVTGHDDTPGAQSQTFLKGAPERILAKCTTYNTGNGEAQTLSEEMRATISKQISSMSERGLRVLATAGSAAGSQPTFYGLEAMQDPPREGVRRSISILQRSGVQVIMITGDNPKTASAIAKQLGLIVNTEDSVLTGKHVDSLTDRQLQDHVRRASVFARTEPQHKLRIVSALQANDAVVGMTGDGVNDSPALKLADVGIAMGNGTDVAKEASDMILVDDNFVTILSAVREGKAIFYNIQNFLSFQLSTSIATLALITLSTAVGLSTPLNPMQILFVNILMDGPPSQSLGVDPAHENVMNRPPRRKDASVLSKAVHYRVIFSAALMLVGTSFVYMYQRVPGIPVDTRLTTLSFTAFVLLDLVSAIQNRGIYTGLLENRMLLYTCGGGALVLFILVYFPPLQGVFQTQALGLRDLFFVTAVAGASFAAHEARREFERSQQSDEDDKGNIA